jgi:putative nucleotidyltransferase with HDIG domain
LPPLSSQEQRIINLLENTTKKLKDHIEELSALYEVGKIITSTLNLDKVLSLITQKATKIMKGRACTLRLLHGNKEDLTLRASYGVNHNSHILKKLKVGESISGMAAKTGKPYIVSDLSRDKRYKFLQLAKKEGFCSLITVPLTERERIIGAISIYGAKPNQYHKDDIRLLSMFADQAAIAIENARLFEQVQSSYLNTIRTLTNIIDAKDSSTYGHSERVMENALAIAEEMKLAPDQRDALQYASFLHDIGKIGIDASILTKPSQLTQEEWNKMVHHPKIGADIVYQIGFLSDLAPIILHHHERYAGGGYPDAKLKGEKIPLGARILAVADAYEAMISDRPYRRALTKEKAVGELKKASGTQFDPKIVKAFLHSLKKNS